MRCWIPNISRNHGLGQIPDRRRNSHLPAPVLYLVSTGPVVHFTHTHTGSNDPVAHFSRSSSSPAAAPRHRRPPSATDLSPRSAPTPFRSSGSSDLPARLVTDGVDRWPFVRRRHTEFDLAQDGTIRRMVMDVRTPNGRSPRERGRRVTADFSKDRVKISVRDSAGVRDTAFATGGAITVPHVSMMYSVIELEISAALRQAASSKLAAGDSVLFRQFYPDRDVGPSFTLHRGYVHPRPGGKVELRHDWLAGTGDVTVDSSGRMLTYSGMRTTYKVAVARTATPPDIDSIADRMAAAERSTGQQQLSVRDTVRATIGGATLHGGLRPSPRARAHAVGERDPATTGSGAPAPMPPPSLPSRSRLNSRGCRYRRAATLYSPSRGSGASTSS